MADYVFTLRNVRKAHGDKPVLLVLQAWAWEPLKDGEKGYPTPHESRFMAYQAVIHGASAVKPPGAYSVARIGIASCCLSLT